MKINIKINLLVLLGICGSIALTILACGGRYDVVVGGNVTVHHQIEIGDLQQYFEAECRHEDPTMNDQQLQDCANQKIAAVIDYFSQGIH